MNSSLIYIRMKNFLLLFAITQFMLACNGQSNSADTYSSKEAEQFLNEITKNVKLSITDMTEANRQATDKFLLITQHNLSAKDQAEYHKNNGTIMSNGDQIYDFVSYEVKNYELENEKKETLELVENGRAKSLQEFSLGEAENVLYRQLGIQFAVNKKFEKINGFITLAFEMPAQMKKEIKIPVNLTINDKVGD